MGRKRNVLPFFSFGVLNACEREAIYKESKTEFYNSDQKYTGEKSYEKSKNCTFDFIG